MRVAVSADPVDHGFAEFLGERIFCLVVATTTAKERMKANVFFTVNE
jgi:hypothetical protein